MTRPYSVAFKRTMVERLIGKDAISANQLARETGVRQHGIGAACPFGHDGRQRGCLRNTRIHDLFGGLSQLIDFRRRIAPFPAARPALRRRRPVGANKILVDTGRDSMTRLATAFKTTRYRRTYAISSTSNSKRERNDLKSSTNNTSFALLRTDTSNSCLCSRM